jgi:hypothetical protein
MRMRSVCVQGAHHDGPALDGLVEDHLVAEDDDLGRGREKEKKKKEGGTEGSARKKRVCATSRRRSQKSKK